jgi:hypothetical protein
MRGSLQWFMNQGALEALEEAAGICDKPSNEYLTHEELAQAIRALKDKYMEKDDDTTRF